MRTFFLALVILVVSQMPVHDHRILGAEPQLLGDGSTQDSDPAVTLLSDGRQLIVWRAFFPSAPSGDASRPPSLGSLGRDQLCACVIPNGGEPGVVCNLLDKPGDIETITVASLDDAACEVVWAERREGNWDLYAGVLKTGSGGQVQLGNVKRLTQNAGVDRSPMLARSADGALILVWQAWRKGRSSIFCLELHNGKWSGKPDRLSSNQANDWSPAVAVSRSGAVAAAWMSWREGSYDVHLRLRSGTDWGPALAVASGDKYEARPSLAYDDTGVLWIAYEEGRLGWGMDSHTAGLRARRNVRLRYYRNGTLEEPTETTAPSFSEEFVHRTERPHLAVDGRGGLWLFVRHLSGRGVWTIFSTSLGENGWSVPVALPNSAAGQDIAMATAVDSSGRLAVAWPSDARTNQVGHDSRSYYTVLESPDSRPARVTGQATTERIRDANPPPDRVTRSFGGRKLSLYFGDLHRHTELSVCQTGEDGSLQDAYRYAIDAAGLDFLCVTDHVQHMKTLNDYDYWRSGKTADLNRVPGVHEPLYGYERSQRWPYGHRNIISPTRDPIRVPRTADNRPTSANQGYPGEVRISPPELWERLSGQNVITIPHTSGNPVMGTNFGDRPGDIEPVVEIYQGCRYSYEYPNAPDPRPNRDKQGFGGALKEGGSIWDALAKGYQYGFIASSDHLATHNSFTCVWAEEFSPAAIIQAISDRQCYAATDRIVCDVRMGGHMMGAQFKAPSVPPMHVKVAGTTHLDRVDIIKDNRIVYTHIPELPTASVAFTYQDSGAEPGKHYYYPRVIQKDRNMAWVSPIWVTVVPAAASN